MALRHSDRHLDPHGHSHGPRRDELHGWRIARACTIFHKKFNLFSLSYLYKKITILMNFSLSAKMKKDQKTIGNVV